jgi:hypothetical protein
LAQSPCLSQGTDLDGERDRSIRLVVPWVVGDVFVGDIDWEAVSRALAGRGWSRLSRAVDPDVLTELETAAPRRWAALPHTEGSAGVRQAGRSCHSDIASAAGAVRALATAIRDGIERSRGAAELPAFNHAEWCQPDNGRMFITPHRDPQRASGVIAIVTLRGRVLFRIWDIDGTNADAERHPEMAEQWQTAGGDVVLMRGGGWPTPAARCPIHEAQQAAGERMTLTLRHNTGGFGADYFAET